jgi:hypothetical protein
VESSGEHYTNPVGKLYFDDVRITCETPPMTIPQNLTIVAYMGEPKAAKLKWDNAMVATGYNMYRNHLKINTSLITEKSYVDNDAPSPDDCYHVTAVYYSDIESGFSNEACIKDVGIKENIPFSGVKIVPNPSDGKISIETGLPTACHLAIFTVQGIKVFEKESFNDGMLDLSNFPKGVYILKISTKDESVAKKIVGK